MNISPHLLLITEFSRHRGYILLVILFFSLLSGGACASDPWQPVQTPDWVRADMPAGWSTSVEMNTSENPDYCKVVAYSPDKNSRLTYILDHTEEEMGRNEIRQYQNSYMSKIGFRICKTKDPVVDEKNSTLSYRQTYVRGTDDAAVIGTIACPGWGQAHYILVMEGPQAVADHYESLPMLIQEHIRPDFTGTTGT
jgi:hypothetical protein